MNRERNEFSAPLDSATAGRLEFVRGADNVTIRADASAADDLYRAHFEGTAPSVRAEDGAVEIAYPWTWNPLDWRRQSAAVTLNGSIPWRIAVGGGLSELDADLGGLRLDSFEVEGGVSRVELTLPEPSGTVPVRIEGGASNVTIRRPKGVAASVVVGCGASELALDEQRLGAVGGEVRLESSGYVGATDRYAIVVGDGASRVSVVAA